MVVLSYPLKQSLLQGRYITGSSVPDKYICQIYIILFLNLDSMVGKSSDKSRLCCLSKMWELPYPFNTVIDDHIRSPWQLLDQINDLSTNSFFYDTSLTLSAYDPTTLEEKLNKDLNEVQKRQKSNKLTLNIKKTKYMIIILEATTDQGIKMVTLFKKTYCELLRMSLIKGIPS